jgi:intein/homing endonuclease
MAKHKLPTADAQRRLALARVERKRKRPKPIQIPDPVTIAWFAGLFEGEGCISIDRNGTVGLRIGMSDRDVIEKLHSIFPCNGIWVKQQSRLPSGNLPKPIYHWNASESARVRTILELLLPWLGERRAAKAREALEHLKTRRGIGYRRHWTHCVHGHEFTPENTYVSPKGRRNCYACRRASYRAKRQAAQAI